jgi:hypothetical protein
VEGDKEMALRFAGACTQCGEQIAQGARAIYSSSTRTVRHIDCAAGPDLGTAGASARREHDRRQSRDEARIAAQIAKVQSIYGSGFIGKVATKLAVDDSPRRSTQVWAQGAVGEEKMAALLDGLADVGVIALHDRRIPGTRANIDHIAITPWGVWVIDAKRYLGKRPDFVTEGGFMGVGGTNRLTVGGRKKDELVDGVLWQIERVQSVVGPDVSVRGALAFVDADWPLIGGDFSVRGVAVLWPRRLPKYMLLRQEPTVDVVELTAQLARDFPPA